MKYILIALFLILPGALLGGDFAGGFWYERDHAIAERTHIYSSNASYFTALRECEITGAIAGSLPGMLILLAVRVADVKARRNAVLPLRTGEADKTVWPPPPNDDSVHH